MPFGLQFELADLNGDGRLDIVSALNQGNGVAVLLNGCGQPAGNLVLSAIDSPDPVDEGATLTYSATVTNAGDTLAANVTLTQTLSALGARGHRDVEPGRLHDHRPAGDVQPRTAGARTPAPTSRSRSRRRRRGSLSSDDRRRIGAAGLEPGRQRRDARDDGDACRP